MGKEIVRFCNEILKNGSLSFVSCGELICSECPFSSRNNEYRVQCHRLSKGEVIKIANITLGLVNEFSFEEVIARIKEGETYEHKDGFICKNNGIIEVVCHNLISSPSITTEAVKIRFTNKHHFKLVEPKNTYLLYDVEHHEGGKRFAFRCDGVISRKNLVLCNTIKGKSYGKVVDVREVKLTQKEYMAYKEILKEFETLPF